MMTTNAEIRKVITSANVSLRQIKSIILVLQASALTPKNPVEGVELDDS
jgi:hypothetical protein